ncbi:hypothetical protein [Deinococcus sp.]|uniref:hypothetical protein n=1 Tax=Deinococcus sp. TaxID=47478 RepID=UPI003CC5772E
MNRVEPPETAPRRRTRPAALAALLTCLSAGMTLAQLSPTTPQVSASVAAARALLQSQPTLAQTRVAVLIPESILRRPVPDPAAETELVRALVNAGIRVVDLSQSLRLSELQRVRDGSMSGNEIRALLTRLGTDVFVTGEAFAEEHGTILGGTRAYTSRLELKAIDLASGQVLYSQAFQGSGIGTTDAVAGKTALMNVGRVAGDTLPLNLLRALQVGAGGVTAPRAFVLRLQAPITFTQVNALVAKLGGSNGVSDVVTRNLDAAGAVVNLSYPGNTTDLAVLLEAAGLTVTGLNGLELTARY